jgi:peptidoglycan-N-acetylglucosamine deacetylase
MLVMGVPAGSAVAGGCPANPEAIGTSRTLVVDPREHPRIGTMQYAETLPLEDHEVVLTFDDGPLPRNSNQILEILASQCVKATFFTVGQMAHDFPAGVRKLRDAGHSIGTHTQNHPTGMDQLPIERVRKEIDDGLASVTAALGDPSAVSPFFRMPGLRRSESSEDYLASKGIQVWSADFPADDWRDISPSRVYDLAMQRLEAKGKGVLLLHDIQARTVTALPRILHELKARGYRIVHVVAATPDLPKTPTEARQWQLHPTPEAVAVHPTPEIVAVSLWPTVPSFTFTNAEMLPAPHHLDPELHDQLLQALPETFVHPALAHGAVPLPQPAPWPRQSPVQAADNTLTLPVPAQGLFQIPEDNGAAVKTLTPVSHRAEQMPARSDAKPVHLAKLSSLDAGAPLRAGLQRRKPARGGDRS